MKPRLLVPLFLAALLIALATIASACGDGDGTDSSSTADDGMPSPDISWIDIAPPEFPLDRYIAPGLMYAIYRADYETVPDDKFTRTIVLGLVRALNDACGEQPFFDVVAYMEYMGASTDPQDIVLDSLEAILAARDLAEQGDIIGGLLAFMDELGIFGIAPEGIEDGNLLARRHGCESEQIAQFRPNLNTIVVDRADQKPALLLDPLVVLLSEEYKARLGIGDVLLPQQPGEEGEDFGSIEPVDVSVSPTLGTVIEYGAVPERFVPDIPDVDSLEPRLLAIEMEKSSPGALVRIRITGFLLGGHGPESNVFLYQGEARARLQEDYTALAGSDALVMECTYISSNVGLDSVAAFWYGSTPDLADPDRLRDRLLDHPVLWIRSGRDNCPETQTEAADAS